MTSAADPHRDYQLVPREELAHRIAAVQKCVAEMSLDGALILDRLNIYYLTGTLQQGVVYAPAGGDVVFFVYRSVERALLETPVEVVPLKGLGRLPDLLRRRGAMGSRLGIDESSLPLSMHRRIVQGFSDTAFEDVSPCLARIRAVKSDYEVARIREAGRRHEILYDAIPGMIREGMTEWELGGFIHEKMLFLEYTGIARLSMFNSELFVGVVSFGESGNYPTASVGPGGLVGLSPAFPLMGGRKRLKKGDPIFVDTGFGYEGYFTDKTRVFCLGPPPPEAQEAHEVCLAIQEAIRCRLKPGAIPSEIFEAVYATEVAPRGFEKHFMGYGGNQVAFLGHGIGLAIDEIPAIAAKVHTPLEANMVIALEPKKGIDGIGLVGIENTFLVTESGGEKLTTGSDALAVL